jgi:hypothetical protein
MAILFLIAFSTPALGQQSSEEELAKKTQNPIADPIGVPLHSNFYFGAGFHHNKMIYVLDAQPVIPVNISDEWNVITRTIMPIINQPKLSRSFGGSVPSTIGTEFGDFNPSFFFSPAKPGALIWGVGPTRTLPTASYFGSMMYFRWKCHPIAKLPVNTRLQAFGNVARPEFGPKWQLRFQIQFLFPK